MSPHTEALILGAAIVIVGLVAGIVAEHVIAVRAYERGER